MTENISTNEAVLRYCLALTLCIVALFADLAPQWITYTSFATSYLAFTAMLSTDPLYWLSARFLDKTGLKTLATTPEVSAATPL